MSAHRRQRKVGVVDMFSMPSFSKRDSSGMDVLLEEPAELETELLQPAEPVIKSENGTSDVKLETEGAKSQPLLAMVLNEDRKETEAVGETEGSVAAQPASGQPMTLKERFRQAVFKVWADIAAGRKDKYEEQLENSEENCVEKNERTEESTVIHEEPGVEKFRKRKKSKAKKSKRAENVQANLTKTRPKTGSNTTDTRPKTAGHKSSRHSVAGPAPSIDVAPNGDKPTRKISTVRKKRIASAPPRGDPSKAQGAAMGSMIGLMMFWKKYMNKVDKGNKKESKVTEEDIEKQKLKLQEEMEKTLPKVPRFCETLSVEAKLAILQGYDDIIKDRIEEKEPKEKKESALLGAFGRPSLRERLMRGARKASVAISARKQTNPDSNGPPTIAGVSCRRVSVEHKIEEDTAHLTSTSNESSASSKIHIVSEAKSSMDTVEPKVETTTENNRDKNDKDLGGEGARSCVKSKDADTLTITDLDSVSDPTETSTCNQECSSSSPENTLKGETSTSKSECDEEATPEPQSKASGLESEVLLNRPKHYVGLLGPGHGMRASRKHLSSSSLSSVMSYTEYTKSLYHGVDGRLDTALSQESNPVDKSAALIIPKIQSAIDLLDSFKEGRGDMMTSRRHREVVKDPKQQYEGWRSCWARHAWVESA